MTRQTKRGKLERERRKKFRYLKNTGKLEGYYKKKALEIEEPKIKPIKKEEPLKKEVKVATKIEPKIMANKVLFALDASKPLNRIARRGIVMGVLTLISVVIAGVLAENIAPIWSVSILVGILAIIDKAIREYLK